MNINLTLIGQMLAFAVFVWFTMRYVWPPLTKAMDERKGKIAEGLAAGSGIQREEFEDFGPVEFLTPVGRIGVFGPGADEIGGGYAIVIDLGGDVVAVERAGDLLFCGVDGIGVASAMALLASDDIQHPPLEALFTIDEETGMTGAMHLAGGVLRGKIMLNLDTEDDDEITIGCAGGVDTGVPFPIERTYREWVQSDFGASGSPVFATCQNCHMPDALVDPAYACIQGDNNRTGDLPMHELAGGNAWIPEVLRGDYPVLGRDAERLAVGQLGAHELGHAGVVVEMARDQRNVDIARLADRLAVIEALQHRE